MTIPFELKPGVVHLLPTFKKQPGEDPHKHMKEFHLICDGMCPHEVTQEQLNLRKFSFSLKDMAKDFLYYFPARSIIAWNGLKKKFLEKFFLTSKAHNIRKEIYGIKQNVGESLYEYWERYKQLCASFPYYQISEQYLIQCFYSGLLPLEKSNIDAATSGALADKMPIEASQLISTMTENSQNFGTRSFYNIISQSSKVSELRMQIYNLISLFTQVAQGGLPQVKACGACGLAEHTSRACPQAQVNAIGGFQRKYDPHGQTYNQGWQDHPNFKWGSQRQYENRNQSSSSSSSMSLEDVVKSFADHSLKFQQELHNLQKDNIQLQQETKQLQ
ncbi:uncharacterized protein LOC120084936 [Benincasa hispida]|uniref:uncharacterized protein LOC120084936 n=1 Tax=Benincasa hispida TaxID=102211 RepID=UPI0019024AEA|nr:uncharacterized protein LOC120084936 [Benincasa hispida]